MQSGVPTKHIGSMTEDAFMDKSIFGVDVAKEWLDLCIAGGAKGERIPNTSQAIAAWIERAKPGLVAFEPTGGYERNLKEALRAALILFIRVHPNDIIAFRKSRGIKAKTDAIDARLIADFASQELERRGLRTPMPDDEILRELAARRRQLVETLQAERCRLDLVRAEAVRNSLTLVIQSLAASLDVIEEAIAQHIAADPQAAQLETLYRSIKGVGAITARTFIADLPELGHLSSKQIASLVGLAPFTRQSGKTKARGRTSYGRPAVRRVLFNAARAAIRHPSPFKEFYNRLVIKNQRPGKVALTAVMRKILVTANAVAREKQPWRHTTA
jgi:transposase